MSGDIPDIVYVSESRHIKGRVSQRAYCYHTDPDCRNTTSTIELSGEEAARRGFRHCSYCAGEMDPTAYRKNYAWDLKGMDDDERAALADSIRHD